MGEFKNDVIQRALSHVSASVGWPSWTYLCAYTGYSPKDLPGAMDDRDGWRDSRKSVKIAWSDVDDDGIGCDSTLSLMAVEIWCLKRQAG